MKAYIRENALESRVKILHNVPNEDLPAIYQMAEACVYPSRYEASAFRSSRPYRADCP